MGKEDYAAAAMMWILSPLRKVDNKNGGGTAGMKFEEWIGM